MKKTLGIMMITASLTITGFAFADRDGDDDDRSYGERKYREMRLDVEPVSNELYLKECGDCHFAYQPGLLPARSWKKMMGELDRHFGENAELDEADVRALTDYMTANAAEHSKYKRSQSFLESIAPDAAPQRISDTPYFKRKHRELNRRMVEDNPQVKSISRCAVCHTKADTGSYEENEINIPGFGKWED